MTSSTSVSPFTRAVVASMRRLYPEHLADKSFDNTGLLLEAPLHPSRKASVLLTIDLTTAVADEAIEQGSSVIVSYHPIIFKGLKSLTMADSQQRSLLRLAAAGISVYSPHSAIDAAPGGNGDWLADVITQIVPSREPLDPYQTTSSTGLVFTDLYQLHHYPSPLRKMSSNTKSALPHTRSVIVPNATDATAGIGRRVTFKESQPLSDILQRVANALGTPKAFQLAIPQTRHISDMSISSVGICAGSGGSILSNLDVDLLLTGELVHHEALAAIEKGKCVIALLHSNSERGYLQSVMQPRLIETLKDELQKDAYRDKGLTAWSVEVSKSDRDPFGFVVFENRLPTRTSE